MANLYEHDGFFSLDLWQIFPRLTQKLSFVIQTDGLHGQRNAKGKNNSKTSILILTKKSDKLKKSGGGDQIVFKASRN